MDPPPAKREARSERPWTVRRILPLAVAVGGLLAAGGIVAWATTEPPSHPGGCCIGPDVAVGAGTAAGEYAAPAGTVYETSIPVQSVGPVIAAEQLSFELQNMAGNRAPFLGVGVIGASGCWVASENGTSAAWAAGPPLSPPPDSAACGSDSGPATELQAGDRLLILTREPIESAGYTFVIEFPSNGSVTVSIV